MRALLVNAVAMGLTPAETYELTVEEFNACVEGYELRRRADTENAILIGYYTAYYTNGGKRVKSPTELIRRLHAPRQNVCEGLEQIRRVKRLEEGECYGK